MLKIETERLLIDEIFHIEIENGSHILKSINYI